MEEFKEVRVEVLDIFQWCDAQKLLAHHHPQEHAKKLLSKEWLAKTDSAKAIPYLFVRQTFRLSSI